MDIHDDPIAGRGPGLRLWRLQVERDDVQRMAGTGSWSHGAVSGMRIPAPASCRNMVTPVPAYWRRSGTEHSHRHRYASKVYHCAGTRWYGKTKQGSYMSEAEARAQGARPDHGKACTS